MNKKREKDGENKEEGIEEGQNQIRASSSRIKTSPKKNNPDEDSKKPPKKNGISLSAMLGADNPRVSSTFKKINKDQPKPIKKIKLLTKPPNELTDNVPKVDVKETDLIENFAEIGEKLPIIGAPADVDNENSNSGSLTDLSTFTSPNILQPVTPNTH